MITLTPRITLYYPKVPAAEYSPWEKTAMVLSRRVRRLFASVAGQKVKNVFGKLMSLFTAHPAQTRETYWQHLGFTIKTSLRFFLVGLVLLAHGTLPFLFTRTASAQIEKLYLLMRSRIPQPRREHLENEYEI